MEWTGEAVRALRKQRGETQGQFAAAVGVDRTTVSRWETGEVEVSPVGAARLDALGREPLSPTADYWRGVTDAANAVREALAAFERAAADAAVIAAASADDVDSPPADAPSHPDTAPAEPRTALRLERGGSGGPPSRN